MRVWAQDPTELRAKYTNIGSLQVVLSHERAACIESDPCSEEFLLQVRERAGIARRFPLFADLLEHIDAAPPREQWKLWFCPQHADTRDAPAGNAAEILRGVACPFPRALGFALSAEEKEALATQRGAEKAPPRAIACKEDAKALHKWAVDLLTVEAPAHRLLGLATLSGRRSVDICSASFSDGGVVDGVQWAVIENYRKDRSTRKPAYKFPLLCAWDRWFSALTAFRRGQPSARAINKAANEAARVRTPVFDRLFRAHGAEAEPATLHTLRKLYVALLPHAYSPPGVSDTEFARQALHHRGRAPTEAYLPGAARRRADLVLADLVLQ